MAPPLAAIRAVNFLLALITASLGFYCLTRLFASGLREYKFVVTTRTLVRILSLFTAGIVLYGMGFVVFRVFTVDPETVALLGTAILALATLGMYYFVKLLKEPATF